MKYKRYFISLVLILAMVSIAEITGEREIIFPEVAALVVGSWVLEKQPWKVSKVGLVGLMTLCSIVGVFIVRYVNLGLTMEVLIGLVFTGLILKLSKTTLVPIISACILPIVLRTETWVYPISVFILTILIVSIKYFIEDYGVSEVREEFKEEIAKLERNTSLRKKEFIRLFKIFITVGILTYFSVKFNITLLIAPPLIVAFIELTNEHCKFRQRSKSLLFLFIVVAILGFIFRIGFNEYLGLPLWLCTIFLLISLFICLEIFNMYFPPVAAIAVLPMLLTSKQVMFYPFQIAIGCFIFITIAMIFFREEKCIVDTFKN
ncbi:TPA: hypothetical protein ACOTHO_000637 [Clostridium perfringens]|uniref:hypothetical protein n=1 Tax=Clostridium perfringens TaxID=1502 RepID=UPI001CC94108|nr:hypothetical protein [Clostridium perfringens]MCC2763535.1 hypothetical protein [Clostridium perfringens]MCG4541582.1 hypothetical protein [Clostridium perfringens]MCG4545545.1 hypothetical protein [Clostridium perfringens]MCG4551901.1 hypothetical protein [Clostridium perfringens]MCG4556183.1 hypothetical protein [Clostridium perfringens]